MKVLNEKDKSFIRAIYVKKLCEAATDICNKYELNGFDVSEINGVNINKVLKFFEDCIIREIK